jgi:hypothetical protein
VALTSGVLLRFPATWLPDILSILRLCQNGVKGSEKRRGAKDGRTVGEFLQYPAEQRVWQDTQTATMQIMTSYNIFLWRIYCALAYRPRF